MKRKHLVILLTACALCSCSLLGSKQSAAANTTTTTTATAPDGTTATTVTAPVVNPEDQAYADAVRNLFSN